MEQDLRPQLERIAAAMLIGTDRSLASGGPADLLAHSAMLGAKSLAGHVPIRLAEAEVAKMPTCPPDDRPLVPAGARAMLERLLAVGDDDLIHDWLRGMAGTNLRLSDGMLPWIAEWCLKDSKRMATASEILGERGRWLLKMNPTRRSSGDDAVDSRTPQEIWETGTPSQRAAVLRTFREQDPAAARALVQATWKQENASARKQLIDVFVEGCTMDDEPFLESVLDDKSSAVRESVAFALGRLDGSRLRARFRERLKQCVTVKRDGASVKVEVEFPKTFDPSWERDGVSRIGSFGNPVRPEWLDVFIRRSGFGFWQELLETGPQGVIEALQGEDNSSDVMTSFQFLASESGDYRWARALSAHLRSGDSQAQSDLLGLIAPALRREDREHLILEELHESPKGSEFRMQMARHLEGPWSRALFDAIISHYKPARKSRDEAAAFSFILQQLSLCADPQWLPEIEAFAIQHGPKEHTREINKSLERLRLRAEIKKEFAP